MAWTFNPPPGWETPPPGWRPEPSWTPPRDWPPAPADWAMWVDPETGAVARGLSDPGDPRSTLEIPAVAPAPALDEAARGRQDVASATVSPVIPLPPGTPPAAVPLGATQVLPAQAVAGHAPVQMTLPVALDPATQTGPKRRRWVPLAAAAAALVIGFALGNIGSGDDKAEARALLASAESADDSAQAAKAEVTKAQADLAAQKAALEKQAADLAARENAVKSSESGLAERVAAVEEREAAAAAKTEDFEDSKDDRVGFLKPQDSTDVSYRNCAEVRAAGAAPLYRGSPGYSSKLDRDGDGVACER